jgi:hypothetical protein
MDETSFLLSVAASWFSEIPLLWPPSVFLRGYHGVWAFSCYLRVPLPARVLLRSSVSSRACSIWLLIPSCRHVSFAFQLSLLGIGFGHVVMEHHHSLYPLMF